MTSEVHLLTRADYCRHAKDKITVANVKIKRDSLNIHVLGFKGHVMISPIGSRHSKRHIA